MRLTRQTNYAVRILMYCAANEPHLSRVPEIASAYDLSEPFLFKILKPLMDAELIRSVRGRNGGIRLARSAEEISLYDVVRVTEDSFELAECFSEGAECPLMDNCALNGALRHALGAFFDVLKQYSIASLAKTPNMGASIQMLLGIEELRLPTHGKTV